MTEQKYIMAIDQGTTSSRAIIFNKAGELLASKNREFEQIYPKAGWVEHNAMDILDSQIAVMQRVLHDLRIQPTELAAIGITNQRETTVIWDKKTGYPIHNAIVWQDRRTAEFCDSIRAEHEGTIKDKAGLVLDAYFSGTKIRWLLDNVPGARERANNGELCFGTMDTWLIWNLTKGREFVTDVTNASRTMLFNIHTGDWDDELLKILDVPKSLLPRVAESSEIVGEASSSLFTSVSGTRIKIAGIVGDQHAATYGSACIKPGMVKNTYGTGCFMVKNTGKFVPSNNKMLSIPVWKKSGETTYGLEGSVFVAGAVVQWLRDELGIIKTAAEVEDLARQVPDTNGAFLVPAFAGMGAPHWDSYARGSIQGLTRGVNKNHIARAALEGIAFQSAELIEAMRSDSPDTPITLLRADGGASANKLLMQFQADILGIPVEVPKVKETTAFGAAFMAGLAVGFWTDETEVERIWQLESRFEPTFSEDQRQTMMYTWRKAVERSKSWIE